MNTQHVRKANIYNVICCTSMSMSRARKDQWSYTYFTNDLKEYILVFAAQNT